jgi:hypothetical protein
MEKTLSYEEQVKVKNLLTKVKSHMASIDFSKDEVYKIIDEVNKILNDKDD